MTTNDEPVDVNPEKRTRGEEEVRKLDEAMLPELEKLTPDGDEPESRFYESHRLRLHYVVWEGSGGPPLLLIHGGRENCRSWDLVARALRTRYTIYAPDMRGHGDSQWVIGGSYGLPEAVADISTLADTLEGPLTIVGHSRGGNVALHFAGAFPERVARVLLRCHRGARPAPGGGWAGGRARRHADSSLDRTHA